MKKIKLKRLKFNHFFAKLVIDIIVLVVIQPNWYEFILLTLLVVCHDLLGYDEGLNDKKEDE